MNMHAQPDPEWQKDAIWFGSIPLHPLGERNSFQCIVEAGHNIEEQRAHFSGMYTQRFLNIIMLLVFLHCLWLSIGMIRMRPHALASWCCLIQTTCGVAYNAVAISSLHPDGATCRKSAWTAAVTANLGEACISAVLLQKAYIVQDRPRWMLVFGLLIIAAPPLLVYAAWASPAIQGSTCECTVDYRFYYPWIRFGLYVPLDVACSAVFLVVVFRHLRRFGSEAWKQLTQSGTQLILCLLLSHLTCLFIIAFDLSGTFSGVVYMLDWFVCSVLIIAHVHSAHTSKPQSSFVELTE
ncbi:hypothetical protein THASP1DRAFT_29787 [Thamnocephalis sphaerospora]|uniref:Uncharacterized protein n=1 Tax=Thamnocephalis sphaerospora TaxID=78915 RepID=A0A4P9XQU0_9FUNG|nr:hypothetical protein THASP1DRAFT_29787 [Thamnocephalis sphaerospora]|eukprot:RKP08408.1 hypothetical protein THASP1DRAFT_29787 [Thamnocephalis sphaerospora]